MEKITFSYGWRGTKILLTIFLCIFVPVYWHYYGLQNFLWVSDLSLFLTVIALWLNSTMLMSIATVSFICAELLWNIDFFAHLFFNLQLLGISDYMFDDSKPLFLRCISLFHVIIPILWFLYGIHYGYNKKAMYYAPVFYWIILGLTYFCTNPEKDINWAFLPHIYHIGTEPLWLLCLALCVPALIMLPTHYVLKILLKDPDNY